MTVPERKLWHYLRHDALGVRFRRQTPIGAYIADFVCFDLRLIIELDGSQHLDNPEDIERDAWFASRGFKTLRFWNEEVFRNLQGVMEQIHQEVERRPSRRGGGPPPALRATSSASEEGLAFFVDLGEIALSVDRWVELLPDAGWWRG